MKPARAKSVVAVAAAVVAIEVVAAAAAAAEAAATVVVVAAAAGATKQSFNSERLSQIGPGTTRRFRAILLYALLRSHPLDAGCCFRSPGRLQLVPQQPGCDKPAT